MNPILCITFRFIQPFPLFHGLGDGGAPEWPPSPMRAFQALVNATSLRHRGQSLPPEVESALAVLESIRPSIIAPDAAPSVVGYRAYVPHNQYDLVFTALHRGMEQSTEAFRKLNGSVRVDKDIRPMRIHSIGDTMPELHYLFPLDRSAEDCQNLLNVIRPCVRSISALGWGIDLVAADVTLRTDIAIPDAQGHNWQPATKGRHRLRVQGQGSLHALRQRYDRFLDRLIDGQFSPVPPVTTVDVVPYASDADPIPRPHAIFKLLDPNEDPARYPHAKLVHIAGMVRHLAIKAMVDAGKDADFVSRFIRGKRDPSAGDDHKQISYVPLPSIGHEHADGMIRNVMLVAPIGMDRELAFLGERLDGQSLQPEGDFEECKSDSSPAGSYHAELRLFTPPSGKFIAESYLGTSMVWRTVTPVILDGHNKKSKTDKPEAIARETEKLICKALLRAGIETPCAFTWQSFPFLKNCLSAHKYDRSGKHTGYHRPTHLKDLTAVHVRLTFDHPVPGPLTLGAGRHCGLGLMAGIDK